MKKTLLAIAFAFALPSTAFCAWPTGPMGERLGESSSFNAVNASGERVGATVDADGHRRAILQSRGRNVELGSLGGSDSTANAINNQGIITGGAQTANNAWHAFRYDEALGMRDLGTLGGGSSVGTAINESGHIVGYADTADGAYHAFVDNGTAMLDLGTLGGKNSHATGVNAKGMVVGSAQLPNGYRRAFLYTPGSGMIEIPTLGGRVSAATAINDAGIVVGASEMPDNSWHAFMYDGKRVIDLGAMIAQGSSYANSINANGDIVGTVRIKDHEAPHTFIYRAGHMQVRAAYDSLYVTRSITDDGQLIGSTFTGQVLRAGTVSADTARGQTGFSVADYLTMALLLAVLAWGANKFLHRRDNRMDFTAKLLAL